MNLDLAGSYVLANDINCSDSVNWNGGQGFAPVGTENTPFRGDFDGKNHKIIGLTIQRSTTNEVGLFGRTDNNEIINVGLEGGNIRGSYYVGSLIGWVNSGAVTNCYATNVVSGDRYIGGLVGYTNAASLFQSYATGSISGKYWIGGLAGCVSYTASVYQCYATGSASAASAGVGGLVGITGAGALISQSYATGSATGSSTAGGLVGSHAGTVSECYSTGSAPRGLIGWHNDGEGVTQKSYWDTQSSGQTSSYGGVGRTTAQMHQQSNFMGWDFTDVWWIDEGNGYPQLQVFVLLELQNPILDQSSSIGQLFLFAIPEDTFGSPNDPVLDYSTGLISGEPLPNWLSFTASSATFSGTPLSGDQGAHDIEVTACNNQGSCISDTFILTILNRSPAVGSGLQDQNVNIGGFLNYIFSVDAFADGDNDPLLYTSQQTGGGALPGWLGFNGGTRTFSGTPVSGNQGTLTLEVTASDGFGGSVSATFTLTINNQAPIVQTLIDTQHATSGQPFNYVVPGNTFNDADGDSLTLSATSFEGGTLPEWLTFTSSTATFSGTPTPRSSCTIELTAADPYGGQVMMRFDIVVPNLSPTQESALLDQVVNVSGALNYAFASNIFLDGDNDPLSYAAELDNGAPLPVWLTFMSGSRLFSGVPASGNQGVLNIRVIADDSYGGNATGSFTLTVNNQPPLVQLPIAAQTAMNGQLFQFVVPENTFYDADGDSFTLAATAVGGGALPSWISFIANSGTFSGIPTERATHAIELIATDPFGGQGIASFDIVVPNLAPIQDNALIDQWLNVSSTLHYVFTASTFSDGDSDTLTYSAQLNGGGGLPSWLSFTSGTRTFSGVPASGDQGVLGIDVTANDGFGGSVTGNFIITVNNQVPTLQTPIGTQTAASALLFQFVVPGDTFFDADSDPLTLSASSAGGGALPEWLSFTRETATFSGTPSVRGNHAIELAATDGFGGQVTETFELTVPNTPPIIANPYSNQDVALNTPFSFSLPGNTFFDQDGDTLMHFARLQDNNPLPAWLSFTPETLTFSGTPLVRESHFIAVYTEDGVGGNVTLLFSLRVANQAPTVANTIATQNAPIGIVWQLTFAANTFDDADGDELTYTAKLNDGSNLPAWVTFLDVTRTFSGTPLSGNQGSNTIVVTADDGFGGQSSTSFSLTIPNANPVLSHAISSQRFNADTPFSWAFPNNTFTDPDGDQLSYTAEQEGGGVLPVWLHFDGSTRVFSGAIPSTQSTPLMITVTASDGFGGQVSDTFELSVNLLPIAAGVIENQAATVGNPFLYTFSASLFTDPDGDPLTYSAQQTTGEPLPAWLTLEGESRIFWGTPTFNDKGFLFISLVASDPFGGTTSVSLAMTISDLTSNNPPLLTVTIPDQTASSNVLWTFTLAVNTFTDPDGDLLVYSATLEGGSALPHWLTFDDQSQVFLGIPVVAEVIRLSVRVDDGQGGFALDTFTLAIQDATNRPPTLLNQLPNQNVNVGSNFRYTIPVDTFTDPNDDVLIYTAVQVGDKPLPSWLKFDGATRTFSGKPKNKDTDTYRDRTHAIQVCASDQESNACSSFTLAVVGESEIQQAITALLILASIASTLFAAYRNRATIWNWACKRWYRRPRQAAIVDKAYTYSIQIDEDQIKRVQAFTRKGKALKANKLLPGWLDYQNDNKLVGTPGKEDASILIIRVLNDNERILAEFELGIFETEAEAQEYEHEEARVSGRGKGDMMMRVFSKKSNDHMQERLLAADGSPVEQA